VAIFLTILYLAIHMPQLGARVVPGRTRLLYRKTSSVRVLLVQVFSMVMDAHSTENSFISLDMDCHSLCGNSRFGARGQDSLGTKSHSRLFFWGGGQWEGS